MNKTIPKNKRIAVSQEVRKHILKNVISKDYKNADDYLREKLNLKRVK